MASDGKPNFNKGEVNCPGCTWLQGAFAIGLTALRLRVTTQRRE